MGHPLTPVALGALAIAGAAFGLHLGESAVADINPVHFQGPAVHPRDRGAAIVEADSGPARSAFAAAYGWEEGARARSQECFGCEGPQRRFAAADPVPDIVPAVAPPPRTPVHVAREQRQERFEPRVRVQRASEAAAPPFEREYAAIERYAYYEVEEAPVGRMSVEQAAPAGESYAGYGY